MFLHMSSLLCVCVVVVGTLQKQKNIAGALAFWMANASELLNFIKQDRDLNRITLDAQDILAHLVQMAFKSVCVWLCEGMWDWRWNLVYHGSF